MFYRILIVSPIVVTPRYAQTTQLSNVKQPASAVVVDAQVDLEVKMKLEVKKTLKTLNIVKAARKSVAAWLCAVRNPSKNYVW